MERIAWLTSARDQAAVDLLNAILANGIRPELVICCPVPGASGFVEQAGKCCTQFGVPQIVFEHPRGKSNEERRIHDEYLWKLLAPHRFTRVFLVGYMRFVTSELLDKAEGTFINLHPATPTGPVGKWEDVVWKLIQTKATETGGMLHVTTKDLDRGPVISYYTTPIGPGDFEFGPLWLQLNDKLRGRSLEEIVQNEGEREPLFSAIRKRQFAREAPLLIVTLRRLQQGMLRIVDGGVTMDGKFSSNGVCLTNEVETALVSLV